jgi:hypothetical protein
MQKEYMKVNLQLFADADEVEELVNDSVDIVSENEDIANPDADDSTDNEVPDSETEKDDRVPLATLLEEKKRRKELEKQVRELQQKFSGINPEEIATRILDARIEEESKTPEQKELETARKKLAEYEEEQKKVKQEAERFKMEKLQQL